MYPRYGSQALVVAGLWASTLASPTPVEREVVTKVVERQAASSSPIINQSQLQDALGSFSADSQSLAAAVSIGQAIFTNIVPAPGPTAAAQLAAEWSMFAAAKPQDIFESGAQILINGFAGGDLETISNGYLTESSTSNNNPINPATPIYPMAASGDAPYSLSESDLRKVIYIPPNFTYGKIQPVIFLPGTAAIAGQNFGRSRR